MTIECNLWAKKKIFFFAIKDIEIIGEIWIRSVLNHSTVSTLISLFWWLYYGHLRECTNFFIVSMIYSQTVQGKKWTHTDIHRKCKCGKMLIFAGGRIYENYLFCSCKFSVYITCQKLKAVEKQYAIMTVSINI